MPSARRNQGANRGKKKKSNAPPPAKKKAAKGRGGGGNRKKRKDASSSDASSSDDDDAMGKTEFLLKAAREGQSVGTVQQRACTKMADQSKDGRSNYSCLTSPL